MYSVLLLMVSGLACITNCTVYYVLPDDNHQVTSNHTNTLRHYLNDENYFTSHTQFIFLPGKHHLYRNLLVQTVFNVTLRGISPQKMYDTKIYCTTKAYVAFISSDNINISFLSMDGCGYSKANNLHIALNIFNCSNVALLNCLIACQSFQCGLTIINAFKSVHLLNVTSSHLMIAHNLTRSNSNMTIHDYHDIRYPLFKHHGIMICLDKHSDDVVIKLSKITMKGDKAIKINCLSSDSKNIITFIRLNLSGIMLKEEAIMVEILSGLNSHGKTRLKGASITFIHFQECVFENIKSTVQRNDLALFMILENHNFQRYLLLNFAISGCNFANISSVALVRIHLDAKIVSPISTPLLIISNSSFSEIQDTAFVIWLGGIHLVLQGPISFTKIMSEVSIIHVVKGTVNLHGGIIAFSLNQAYCCIVIDYIAIAENTKLVIEANSFSVVFYTEHMFVNTNVDTLCTFQYIRTQTNIIHKPSLQIQQCNYSILLQDNNCKVWSNKRYAFSHCNWISDSVFIHLDPLEVNQYIVHAVNNSKALTSTIISSICYCTDSQHYNCSTDELGSVYPGQTYSLTLLNDFISSTMIEIDTTGNRACKSHSIIDQTLLIPNTCIKMDYNILHKRGRSCIIYIRVALTVPMLSHKLFSRILSWNSISAYKVKISPCPLGFALNKVLKSCQCDPIIIPFVISTDSCNINTQTVQRSSNSWITGRTNKNNSHTYQVSTHCPFDYCVPYSSHINLYDPDSQCQFNRTGVLCGKCKEGLSTVFGTSNCKHCSNYYLFLIFLFLLLGIVLIIFLFSYQFPVSDVSIIFYANLVSINGAVFFPVYKQTKYAYSIISFINLDLGIEVCFYDGMDDYAKMWLQLIFPIYLIFISTLLIITSRFSTRIQRLTAHRALPVLATLFLLSYTKILRTVSSVLFSYSTITSLPSKSTTLMWSVDTGVQLFGLNFIVLFIVCLVLFLILLLFNTVLIFTRTLSQFKFINHFKPLLDVYQGPYKDRFYYWIGLQLLLRAIFYGISALDRNTNMMIGILIIGVVECMHGAYFPFKNKSKNYQELLLLFNIQTLFTVSIYTTSNSIAVNVLVGIAVVQFVAFRVSQTNPFGKAKAAVNRLLFNKLKLAQYISFTHTHASVASQQALKLHNTVPDVTYNFKEFQDPLIGFDR